jgi:hypothetical protein
MTNALTAGVSTAITARHCPIAQGRVPPLVKYRHRPGESPSCVDACLGLLLHRDTGLCLLISVGSHLLRMR